MSASHSQEHSISTAVGRWKSFGPYYAMFPVDFAFDVVSNYSSPEDGVFDPFAGRATSVYAAVAQGRFGFGVEINPVGWLYGEVKLQPAFQINVIRRIEELHTLSKTVTNDVVKSLPEFFQCCYCVSVLRYLLTARMCLRWKDSIVDKTLMALILVNLHGKQPGSLSNQMRQGKAMAPDYSVRWWLAKGQNPPEIDPVDFLKKRVAWRYAKGRPQLQDGKVVLGNSVAVLKRLSKRVLTNKQKKFSLLFTSPPYYSITNYYKDQWLRIWMLGGPERPVSAQNAYSGRFESRVIYKQLLTDTFNECAGLMSPQAVAYIRTDAREFTYQTTLDALRSAFPRKEVEVIERPFERNTQTALFGDKEQKPGEVDIILRS